MGFTPIPKPSFGMKTLRESCELTIKGGVTSRKKIPLLNYSGPKFAFTKLSEPIQVAQCLATNLFAASNVSAFFDGFCVKCLVPKKTRRRKTYDWLLLMAQLERWLLLMGLRKRQTHILEGERVAHVRASHCAIFPNNTDRPQTTLHQRKIEGLRRPFRPVTRVTRGSRWPGSIHHQPSLPWKMGDLQRIRPRRLAATLSDPAPHPHPGGKKQDAMVHPGWHLQTL